MIISTPRFIALALGLAAAGHAAAQHAEHFRHADQQAWFGDKAQLAKAKSAVEPSEHYLPPELEAKRMSVAAHLQARLAGVAPALPKLPVLDIAPAEGLGLDCASAVPLDGGRSLRFTAFPDRPTFVRLTPGAARRQVNTFGSEVDMALTEVDCDGKRGHHNDDAVGLQAALAATDDPMVIRVDAVSEPGQVVIQVVEASVFVSGRVVRADDGSPVANIQVEFRRDIFSVGSGPRATTDSTGTYRIATNNAPSGLYVVNTFGGLPIGLIDSVFPRGYCVPNAPPQCDQTAAQRFSVSSDLDLAVPDFPLDRAADFQLQLTDGLTGATVPNARTWFLNSVGAVQGQYFPQSDAQGLVRIWVVPGSVQVRVESTSHLTRLVRGLDCPVGNFCTPSAAPVIPAASGEVISENEALTPTASIRLTLPGADYSFATVRAVRENGAQQTLSASYVSPFTYSIGPLEPGRYKLVVETPGFFGKANDGTECIAPCDPSISSVFFDVAAGSKNHLELSLRPWPTLTVDVVDADSQAPITSGLLRKSLVGGSTFSANIGANGRVVIPMHPGLALIHVSSDFHLDQIYDGVACELDQWNTALTNCPNATPLFTDLNTPERSLRFDLAPSGRVSGRIRTNSPTTSIPFPTLSFITGGALPLSGYGRLEITGPDRYQLRDIPPIRQPLGALSSSHFPTVFEGILCPVIGGTVNFAACNLSLATPIQITRGEHVEGIDFLFEPRFSIRGRVLNRSDGSPISGLPLVSRDTFSGYSIRDQAVTDADGRFVFATGLSTTRLIHTAALSGWVNQAFSGRVCALADPNCILQLPFATPISSQTDSINPNQIEFRLDPVEDLIYLHGFE